MIEPAGPASPPVDCNEDQEIWVRESNDGELEIVPDPSECDIDFHIVASEPGRLLQNHFYVRSRLKEAYSRADLIITRAAAQIDLRWRAEAPELQLSKYMKSGQALIDFTNANVRAVRLILLATLDWIRKDGIFDRVPEQLCLFFEAEMKFVFLSHQVPRMFKWLLRQEFRTMCLGPDPGNKHVAVTFNCNDENLAEQKWMIDGAA
jgi:hypothetical protein